MPFCRSRGGGSQWKSRVSGPSTVILKFSGAAVGGSVAIMGKEMTSCRLHVNGMLSFS